MDSRIEKETFVHFSNEFNNWYFGVLTIFIEGGVI